MSQLSLNQTIQSRVTETESVQKKGIFKNTENHPNKKRPASAVTPKVCNDDNASIGTNGGDFTRVRKLGHLPSYLKKQTKSSVESELVTKHKKFRIAKKELTDKQTTLMNDYKQLQSLKDKFKQLGGRDFKLDIFKVVEFTDYGIDNNGFGDGQNLRMGDCVSNSQMFEFQREIQRIRGRVKDCLFKLIELNADAFKHIQASGTEALQEKIQEIFSKVEEYVKTVNHEQDDSMQFLLEKLQQMKNTAPDEVNQLKSSTFQEEKINGLQTTIQNLEVQSKMLQSEIDVKNQEIEYLKNKEVSHCTAIDNNEQESQQGLINDFRTKLNEYVKQQEAMESKIVQLEEKVCQKNLQIQENLSKYEHDLSEERKKCEYLENVLEEMKEGNSRFLHDKGSSFELMSNQLASATEDIKELQFKICKRDKQIQNLKQIVNSESNKAKDHDTLLLKYDELLLQDQCKSKELHQLKEKLIARTDTINSQTLTIFDLKKKLISQGASGGGKDYAKDKGPLHEEHMTKFLEHERIIKKLENNKIRSNVLRDQLLDRISMLEKENDDMKAQIRKFHEDFTINRFMHDEQRRKKRLTEILVKQYQK